eukprot:TRINITY_DN32461_c0_g1_i2.p1 TRINITY_DN32461_c0_g1~~TRINITY_DN32461_c0_g1_i2.p1  ORF type:complete len:388 (+),score=100.60 TRINITY_DN32461_c0_g1_i2:379-1542(+)
MGDPAQKKAADLLNLAQVRFTLTLPDDVFPNKDAAKQQLQDAILANDMGPFYTALCEEFGWTADQALASKLAKTNAEKLDELEDKIRDCEENLGESEIAAAMLAKAMYYVQIGSRDDAMTALQLAFDKTVPLGHRQDIIFTKIRVALFHNDRDTVKKEIEQARILSEKGGDWDRRNRLKVYEGLFNLMNRRFEKAAQFFLDSLATFTCYELCSYNTFVGYTVLASTLTLDRPNLKKKVVTAPEVLTVIDEIPHLTDFLNSLYNCQYGKFFESLAHISDSIKADRFLADHARFYTREMRVVAYTQFLESYLSVTTQSMASVFGVSPEFLDAELSRFIASGRLHCKIDHVRGVVETNRPDNKNAQYQNVIKEGDHLLTRIQKLSRVISI